MFCSLQIPKQTLEEEGGDDVRLRGVVPLFEYRNLR